MSLPSRARQDMGSSGGCVMTGGRSLTMRLIHASTLALVEFFEPNIPEYAILSHTWEDGEVSFQEMGHPSRRTRKKPGFVKIKRACELTLSLKLQYIWVDTCCIDKTSSAELTESINSMFAWYKGSEVCIVFLADYHLGPDQDYPNLGPCRWFTRGWTLQELIAPSHIRFYNSKWESIGTKLNLGICLSKAARIPFAVLIGALQPREFSVAQRMSWAADRKTTRVEDRAYSLLGLFNISMPMIYGEGIKAFGRLQEEIIKQTNDLTILAWRSGDDTEDLGWISPCPALASTPDDFQHSHNVQRSAVFEMPTSLTNRGLQLAQRRLFIYPCSMLREGESGHQFLLEVGRTTADILNRVTGPDETEEHDSNLYVCISLRKVGFGTYVRESRPQILMFRPSSRFLLTLTVPHKFLLVTDPATDIPLSIRLLLRRGEALHGAIHIAPPSDQDCHYFREESPTPAAAYDFATNFAFVPRGIGLEVFACEYVVTIAAPPLRASDLVFGVLVASGTVARIFHPATTLAIVDLRTEEAKMVFMLMRRNVEEPLSWLQVLEILGRQVPLWTYQARWRIAK
ncbi:heterokaryon incompatibility protein-domain-containing protein [Podospora conica]|nr:heterokaryon incompatibility protein-domain-containing protein [Schizothecium conicum]